MKTIFFLSIFTCISFCTTQAAQLAAGEGHSMVLKENGTVWAWGYNNDYGQLGDGTIIDRLTPVQVVGLTDVVSISAGSDHSLALKRDGTAWAWGYNRFGQLGNGTVIVDDQWGQPIPMPTPGQVIGLSYVIAVAAGMIHSLFLKSDGTVWACGSDRKGQLGDGTGGPNDWSNYSAVPGQVVGLSNVIAIAGGSEHSLALKSDGTVWAWGHNGFGQLGDGNGGQFPDYTNSSTVPVQTIGLSNVIAISAGGAHSLALKNDGTVWAWGANDAGNLGDGNSGHTTNGLNRFNIIPVQSLVSGVVAIEAGNTYSIALTSYGMIWFYGSLLWSYTNYALEFPTPVLVEGISNVKMIAGGNEHVLAIKNDGMVWAWGENDFGQLGDGTTTSRSNPVQVQEFSTDSSVPIINPNVKVNNVDGPLTVSAFTPITVTVQISPAYLGLEADWWIAAQGDGAWFYLTLEDFLPKWTAMTDYTEMQPIAQGPLAPIGPVPIIESEYWLPRGDYQFFFAVDTLMDGLLTLEALHYDSAILTIQ